MNPTAFLSFLTTHVGTVKLKLGFTLCPDQASVFHTVVVHLLVGELLIKSEEIWLLWVFRAL